MGNTQPVKAEDRRTVVLLGMGPMGVAFLKTLISNNATSWFNIIIVEPKDSYHHTVGALRSVVEPGLAQRIIIPYTALLQHVGPTARHVAGRATAVTETAVTVELNIGGTEQFTYDYLVIGVGTTIPFPGKWIPGENAGSSMLSHFAACQSAIAAAKSIVIMGGGAVGVELSGEIATAYTGEQAKTITLVNSGATLLAHEHLKPETVAAVVAKLTAVGVHVVTGVRATLEPAAAADGEAKATETHPPFVQGPTTVTLSNGTTLSADVVMFCTGARVNNSCLSGQLAGKLDITGRLKVTPQLQVEGFPNIFAGGDVCNTPEGKIAYFAGLHGDLIAKNLIATTQGKALKAYKPSPPVIFLPVGKGDGVGQLPNGMIVGKRMVPMIKGKDLFIGATRKNLYAQ